MDIGFSRYLSKIQGYKSASQKARILTEAWASDNLECPSCGGTLSLLPANSRTSDFQCQSCGETYQLKSQSKPFGKKILGAEYNTTIQAIKNGRHPSLILLQYDLKNLSVQQVRILHRSWITEQSIIPRRPLGPQARRAGWQGCLLALESIPCTAFVDVVQNGSASPPTIVRLQWQTAHSVSTLTLDQRGWVALVLRIVESLPQQFTLQQVYAYEKELAKSYPANQNIRAKIRQQLQIIRDLGLIQFIKPGVYRKIYRSMQ
ncbi:Dam-replacing family [Bellilinea caldifistulae]|uniref:DpnI domain-containing protein n=1 Tax=Bellilinea caldifistulae TaxID=360411 RepID=UPI00078075F5|nr:Dam-replacing family [Bellilinea caldifistulae]